MPKILLTQAERQEQKIIRLLSGAAKGHQKDLAEIWNISQPAVSKRLACGNVTLFELWQARDVLQIDEADVIEIMKGRC